MRHVVWDWNGTLFDDQHLVVDGLNAVLDDADMPRVDLETYQRLYTRPVHLFYERVFGRPIDDREWARIDQVFHEGYRAAMARAGLAGDAEGALEALDEAGWSQSLLSMYPHEHLVPLVSQLGIAERFARIDGLRGDGGGIKAPHLERHLAELTRHPAAHTDDVVVVGDALDDAAAAQQVGVACVLYDGGAHARGHLEETGVPVASTLTEALVLAGFR